MMCPYRFAFTAILIGCSIVLGKAAQANAQVAVQMPDAIAAKGEAVVLTWC